MKKFSEYLETMGVNPPPQTTTWEDNAEYITNRLPNLAPTDLQKILDIINQSEARKKYTVGYSGGRQPFDFTKPNSPQSSSQQYEY